MAYNRRSAALFLLGFSSRLFARLQTIPNPNASRLGSPDMRPPTQQTERRPPDRQAQLKQAHDEALAYAEQLLGEAQSLRDDLKKAGAYVVPVASIKQTERIEKLAKKIREQLKT